METEKEWRFIEERRKEERGKRKEEGGRRKEEGGRREGRRGEGKVSFFVYLF